ncbi:lantibiotic ABC transporter, membrane protein [Streptococcus infantarius subsp. infantarius]|nr:lantibiotic ABC transporter, membrane protein [Streptococcus infantarius subsp. infantarius]
MFLFTLAGLLFVYDYKAEEGAGHFQNTLQGKLTGKIKVAKVMTALKNLFLASCVLLLFLYLVSFVFCGVMTVHFFRDAWVLLLMLIASAWNVPLLFYLSKWINCYLVLVLNSFLCLLVAPFLAQTSFWYLFPYTYHYKIAQAILHLKPSGEVEVLNHPHPVGLCIVAISLSVLLFLIFIKALKEQKRG